MYIYKIIFQNGVYGNIKIASPITGCYKIKMDIKDTIVLVTRGKCSFSEKIKNIQKAGGIIAIIIDDDDVKVFLFYIDFFNNIFRKRF